MNENNRLYEYSENFLIDDSPLWAREDFLLKAIIIYGINLKALCPLGYSTNSGDGYGNGLNYE